MNNLTTLKESLVKLESDPKTVNFGLIRTALNTSVGSGLILKFKQAIGGDETAAFALMREVLGDRWVVRSLSNEDYSGKWFLTLRSDQIVMQSVFHKSLPTAILIAVIKALIFEKENTND